MTEAVLNVRRALEQHLLGMDSPAMDTAFDNQAHSPPAVTVPYQRASLMVATPDNSTQGPGTYLEHGVFQVDLCYQFGKGSKDQETRLGLLRARFKRGTALTEGGTKVTVTHTPSVANGFQEGDRWVRPVSIRWQAWVTP